MINYTNSELNSDYQRQCHFDDEYAIFNEYGATITGEGFDFAKNRRMTAATTANGKFSVVHIRLHNAYYSDGLKFPRVRLYALAWGTDMDPERFHGTDVEKKAIRHLLGYLKFVKEYPSIVQKLNPGVNIHHIYNIRAYSKESKQTPGILMPGKCFLSKKFMVIKDTPALMGKYFAYPQRRLSEYYGERFKFNPETGEWTDLEKPVPAPIPESEVVTPIAEESAPTADEDISELGVPYIGDDGGVVLPDPIKVEPAIPPMPEIEPVPEAPKQASEFPDLEALVELIESEVTALAPNVDEISTKEEAWAARRGYGEFIKQVKAAIEQGIEDGAKETINKLNAKIVEFDL